MSSPRGPNSNRFHNFPKTGPPSGDQLFRHKEPMGDISQAHHKEVFKSLGHDVGWHYGPLFLLILSCFWATRWVHLLQRMLPPWCAVRDQQLPLSQIGSQVTLYLTPISKDSSWGSPWFGTILWYSNAFKPFSSNPQSLLNTGYSEIKSPFPGTRSNPIPLLRSFLIFLITLCARWVHFPNLFQISTHYIPPPPYNSPTPPPYLISLLGIPQSCSHFLASPTPGGKH